MKDYKKEYRRAKTKLEFMEAIGLTMLYVAIFIVGIVK